MKLRKKPKTNRFGQFQTDQGVLRRPLFVSADLPHLKCHADVRYRPAMQMTETIIAELVRVYETAVSTLQGDIAKFASDGTLPPPSRPHRQGWCYPELRIHYAGVETGPTSRAFGRLGRSGTFATTVTRPALFSDYLSEQLACWLMTMRSRLKLALDSGNPVPLCDRRHLRPRHAQPA
jgi:hypothetical protein